MSDTIPNKIKLAAAAAVTPQEISGYTKARIDVKSGHGITEEQFTIGGPSAPTDPLVYRQTATPLPLPAETGVDRLIHSQIRVQAGNTRIELSSRNTSDVIIATLANRKLAAGNNHTINIPELRKESGVAFETVEPGGMSSCKATIGNTRVFCERSINNDSVHLQIGTKPDSPSVLIIKGGKFAAEPKVLVQQIRDAADGKTTLPPAPERGGQNR